MPKSPNSNKPSLTSFTDLTYLYSSAMVVQKEQEEFVINYMNGLKKAKDKTSSVVCDGEKVAVEQQKGDTE
ncbi:uncharacterized protein G2W53_022515 [Senna tora]|uniref:Uncharacterized protein n=1 Tax=Senna tora TaxID=362788 RepID=A0A834TNU3_9FABA|nr:uncharacterized protein G2W53_022515 [Senna tora]